MLLLKYQTVAITTENRCENLSPTLRSELVGRGNALSFS
jgi:hypothetical protein